VTTGDVQTVWKHLSFLGDESQWAAEASECASAQGRFWEYHDRLFAASQGRDKGVFLKPLLKQYAADVGLDRVAFATCLDSGRYADSVRAATADARRAGVERTPTLEINGERLVGATPEQVRAAIERANAGPAS